MSSVAGSTPASPATSAGSAVFVGREPELTQLHRGFHDAEAGRGGLILLLGEPGIGKTRLATELGAEAAGAGAAVLWGRCWEGGGAPAYWPWVQVVRALVDLQAAHGRDHDIDPWREDLAPLLGRTRAAGAGDSLRSSDGDQARFRLFDSTALFLKAAAVTQPLLVILDDLHAVDQPSLLLLQFLTRALHDARVLIVGTSREAEVRRSPALAASFEALARTSLSLHLSGLGSADLNQIIDRVSASLISEQIKQQLLDITGGNPFFVNEVLSFLASRPDGYAGLSERTLRGAVPDNVREAIRRRIEPLGGETQGLLQLAAVLGREFDVTVLDRFTRSVLADAGTAEAVSWSNPPTRTHLIELLAGAQAVGILSHAPDSAGRYGFVHALIGEALRHQVAPALRMQLHHLAGNVLEGLLSEQAQPNFAELAHHYFQAAVITGAEKATEYELRAGDQALDLMAYEDAAAHYERALEALDFRAPDDALRCEGLLRLGEAQRRSLSTANGSESFKLAASWARKLGDATRLARAALGFSRAAESGRIDAERIAILTEALDQLGTADSPWRARVLARLAMALYFTHDSARCIALSGEAVDIAHRIGDGAALVATLIARHFAIWGPDGIDERLRLAAEIIERAEASGQRDLAAEGRLWFLVDLLESGDLVGFHREWEALSRNAAALRVPIYRWHLHLLQGMRAVSQGRLEDAETAAADALNIGLQGQIVRAEPSYTVQLLYLRRRQGRLAEIEGVVRAFAEQYVALPIWRCALAALYCELGHMAEARAVFESLAANRFGDVPRDGAWLSCLAELTGACVTLGDHQRATVLYELLQPYAGRHIIVAEAIVYPGPATYFLGLLAAMLERWDEAQVHFEAALASASGFGATLHVADTQYAFARMLQGRNALGDRTRAAELVAAASTAYQQLGIQHSAAQLAASPVATWARGDEAPASQPSGRAARGLFRRDGDYWTLDYADRVLRMKDSRGIFYLHYLLRHPRHEIHCFDLIAAAQGGVDPATLKQRVETVDPEQRVASPDQTSAPLLDAQAKAAYRQRLHDLQAELSEAESFNDLGRVERARTEIDLISAELSAAVGLGGRDRRLSTGVERARIAVTKAIGLTYKALAREHPLLRAYLAKTIRTGQVCVYSPDSQPAVDWTL